MIIYCGCFTVYNYVHYPTTCTVPNLLSDIINVWHVDEIDRDFQLTETSPLIELHCK